MVCHSALLQLMGEPTSAACVEGMRQVSRAITVDCIIRLKTLVSLPPLAGVRGGEGGRSGAIRCCF